MRCRTNKSGEGLRNTTAAGLVPLLHLASLPGCAARHMPEGSRVRDVKLDTKTEVQFYEDEALLGACPRTWMTERSGGFAPSPDPERQSPAGEPTAIANARCVHRSFYPPFPLARLLPPAGSLSTSQQCNVADNLEDVRPVAAFLLLQADLETRLGRVLLPRNDGIRIVQRTHHAGEAAPPDP